MSKMFTIRVSGTHPITSEPFIWHVRDHTPRDQEIFGVRYRCDPTEPGQQYSAEEADKISQSLTDKGIVVVEIIPVRLN